MAIAKNPRRKTSETDADRQAAAFISGAGQPADAATDDAVRRPIMVRFPPELLTRIDRAPKRLGLTRSAFIVSSAAERLERME
jgi:hypothetical protein